MPHIFQREKPYLIAGFLILVVIGAILMRRVSAPTVPTGSGAVSYRDLAFTIEGQTARYFGNDVIGDLNGDGRQDAAFLVTRDGGGSGIFYYVVAALGAEGGFSGTNAVFLGDRIAPQTTELREGRVIVNYADRAAGEPMTARPSVGASKVLKLDGGRLVESVP